MAKRKLSIDVELEWDDRREDPRGALAATFAAMAEGVANGKTTGPLPHSGSWTVRNGATLLQRQGR